MNELLMAGTALVTCALITYTLFFITLKRKGRLTLFITLSLSAGVFLDVSATTLMILGSKNTPLTVHGLLGYSALSAMIIETILLWRLWRTTHGVGTISVSLSRYTWAAYIWWIAAYVTGGLLASLKLN